jgi:hypothetical protein
MDESAFGSERAQALNFFSQCCAWEAEWEAAARRGQQQAAPRVLSTVERVGAPRPRLGAARPPARRPAA